MCVRAHNYYTDPSATTHIFRLVKAIFWSQTSFKQRPQTTNTQCQMEHATKHSGCYHLCKFNLYKILPDVLLFLLLIFIFLSITCGYPQRNPLPSLKWWWFYDLCHALLAYLLSLVIVPRDFKHYFSKHCITKNCALNTFY